MYLILCLFFVLALSLKPRMAAVGGNLLVNTTNYPNEQALAAAALALPSCIATSLPLGAYPLDAVNFLLTCPPNDTLDDHVAAAVVNWQVEYSVPNSCFDPVTGIFTARRSGHYYVSAKLGVFTGVSILNQQTVPKLNLIYNNTDGEARVVAVSYAKSLIIRNFTIENGTLDHPIWRFLDANFAIENGTLDRPIWRFLDANEFIIVVGVSMKRYSTLRLYYKDDTFATLAKFNPAPPFPPANAWTVTPYSAAFTVHRIGSLTD